MKVLIADDSGTMRTIVARSVESNGIKDIVQACDGKEAIDLFKADSIDFVITDWNMPNMTGIDLIRAIRETNTEVPIIMITTEAEREKVLEAIQAGVTDYLAKPFTPDQLVEKLDKLGCCASL